MNKDDLYEYLDIEDPSEFEYFENIAALLECEDDIDYEALSELIKEVDKDKLAGLIDNYFEEMLDFLPTDSSNIYTILENVRRALLGLSRNIEDENTVVTLVDEIDRFRKFYALDSKVFVTEKATCDEFEISILDAVYLAREENLTASKYEYDFSECDYEIEEYVMSFADMITLAESEDDQTEIEKNVLGEM